jgi:hypothetical protein
MEMLGKFRIVFVQESFSLEVLGTQARPKLHHLPLAQHAQFATVALPKGLALATQVP